MIAPSNRKVTSIAAPSSSRATLVMSTLRGRPRMRVTMSMSLCMACSGSTVWP
jgi:hypothetical protein